MTPPFLQKLGLVQLSEVVLRHNAIRTVEPWAFSGLRRLRYLDLSHNHLQMLYPNTFAANRGLKTLLLAGNNLARLPSDRPLAAAPRLQVGRGRGRGRERNNNFDNYFRSSRCWT